MPWPEHDPEQIRRFVEELCASLGLGFQQAQAWREGASNAIWAVDTDQGSLVFKVCKLEHWRRLSHEVRVLASLDGADTPRVCAHGQAEEGTPALPWDWTLMHRVEGSHLHGLDGDQARKLGAVLCRIRNNARIPWLPERPWRVFVQEKIAAGLAVAPALIPALLRERFDALISTMDARSAELEVLDTLPQGLSHGDVIPLNCIYRPDNTWCLIDWENPCSGSLAWDLAGIRKSFYLAAPEFEALCQGANYALDESGRVALLGAEALYLAHVASWRCEVWYCRGKTDYGDQFLGELESELSKAEQLLRTWRDA